MEGSLEAGDSRWWAIVVMSGQATDVQQCPSVTGWPGLHSVLVTVRRVGLSRVSWSSLAI